MRIIIVSTSYPTNDDGSEAAGSFVEDFASELVNQGHQVVVVAPVTGEMPRKTDKQGIEYFWFNVSKLPLSLLSPSRPQDWWPIISTLQQGKNTLDQAVKAFQPDHILALWALPSGYWAKHIKQHYGIPYSIWALGSDIWSLGKVPIIKHYLKQALRAADNCFADGYQLAEDVTKISGKPCEFLPTTRQLPVCGLPLTQTKPPYRLCFLGRWHHNKGIDLLLEALLLLDDRDWGKIEEVRIAGGGPLKEYVKEQVAKLQQKGRAVSLMGYQDKLGAAELLIWTDYIIIPSRIESIPVIFSDAMQAMRPVIAMPVGDIPFLLSKKNGLLVDNMSIEALLEALRNSLRDNPLRFNNGIKKTKMEFDLDDIAKKFISYSVDYSI